MLTKNQLVPLFGIIETLNNSATGDGCFPPCVIVNGDLLSKAIDEVRRLQGLDQQPTLATQEFSGGTRHHLFLVPQGVKLRDDVAWDALQRPYDPAGEAPKVYRLASPTALNPAPTAAQLAAAKAFGFAIHLGTDEEGDPHLKGRWWWTVTTTRWAGIETSSDTFLTEDDAWADAVREHRDLMATSDFTEV